MFDSVYTPRKTRLLKEAEAAGAVIVSGVEMFLRQAVGQFNLFTGGQEGKLDLLCHVVPPTLTNMLKLKISIFFYWMILII